MSIRKTRTFLTKAAVLAIAVLSLLLHGRIVHADVLTGPASLPYNGGANVYWGLQFQALNTSTLTGFDFSHRSSPTNPHSGTITLTDVTAGSTIIYSTTFNNNGDPVIHFSPNVLLTAGHTYDLINTQLPGGLYSDAVRYSQTGMYINNFSLPGHDLQALRGLYDTFTDPVTWLAFQNLTTQQVPEPASLAVWSLLSMGGAAMSYWRRRRRSA